MCGICGIYRFDRKRVDEQQLLRMNQTMVDRGPDGEGVHISGCFGMAMRRLSIIDPKGGQQPIFNEDKSLAIVLNGEIYNYIELRVELEERGHRFRTGSDVEVLLHLYEEEGTDAIQRLNGMFAFSIWDERRQQVWVGRDRLGIKPLVYFSDDKCLVFGSVLDVVSAFDGYTKEIDEDALLLYFSLGYVPTPKSIYKNIHKLPPGHWMMIGESGVRVHEYWKLPDESEIGSRDDFEAHVEKIFEKSIEFRSRSDVPVGCMLSGGLDSSAVTAFFCRRSNFPVHTYAMDFDGKEASEEYYANLVAEQYQTDHHPYSIMPSQAIGLLKELVPKMDEPMADSAIVPSYLISKMAREDGIKVILSGNGGDELFGGYLRHYPVGKASWAGKLNWLPRGGVIALGRGHPQLLQYGLKLHSKAIAFAVDTSGAHLGVLQQLMRKRQDFVMMLDFMEEKFSIREVGEVHQGVYARMRLDVQNYLLDNGLSLLDKTTMAASVEGRVPLLDHRMVELVFSTLPAVNVSNDFSDAKISLKRVVGKHLPDQILNRSKVGFNAPVYNWMPELIGYFSTNGFTNPVIKKLFDVKQLWRILGSPSRTKRASEMLFMLLVFDIWWRAHK